MFCASFPAQVLVGPRSSGKTALLKNVLASRSSKPVLIDGRDGAFSSPARLARFLVNGAAPLADSLGLNFEEMFVALLAIGQWVTGSPDAVKTSIEAVKLKPGSTPPADPNDIQPVLEKLMEFCADARDKGVLPSFCLDEANMLMYWPAAALRTLMAFLVKVRFCQ